MFETVLVAGRGEIARRIIRTLRRLEMRSVAAYSEADAGLPFVHEADEAVLLGPADPRQSYLDGERLIEAARRTGAQAVHPCYGFLSESAAFAEQVHAAGLVWIGPPPAAMAAMADKIAARRTMAAAGVPVAAGTDLPVTDIDAALAAAARLGYPLMVKASAGGGGIGMGAVHDDESLRSVFASAQSRAERLYGSADILLERYLAGARHVEVQILGPERRPRRWRSGSATARCSVVTRRSPRRPRRPRSARSCGPDCSTRRCGPALRWAT